MKTPNPTTMRTGAAVERPYYSVSNALIAVTPGAAELDRTGITGIGNANEVSLNNPALRRMKKMTWRKNLSILRVGMRLL